MIGDESEEVVLEFDVNPSDYLCPVMNAYLGSALTGISKRKATHIAGLRQVITEVFAGYRANHYSIYDPAKFTAPGTNHTAGEVWTIDQLRVVKSDLFVCLHTNPSCGLGIESVAATHALVPRLLISPQGVDLSRMLIGNSCDEIDPIVYQSPKDLRAQLSAKMREIDLRVQSIRPKRRRLLDDCVSEYRGRKVLKARLRRGLTRHELFQITHVPEHMILAIETHELITAVVASTQWSQLATALNYDIRLGRGATISLVERTPCPSPIVSQSLDNYVDFILGSENVDDRRAVSIWTSYEEMHAQALAGRESPDDVVSIDAWREIYNSRKLPPTRLI